MSRCLLECQEKVRGEDILGKGSSVNRDMESRTQLGKTTGNQGVEVEVDGGQITAFSAIVR